jgi:hypothetical protein
MGRFIFTLFSALAQLEREQIAEQTSTAMLRHQAKGRRMTRPDRCPYGWRPAPSDPARLVEDADEQATIRRIREDRRIGRGLREIARRLDLAGNSCRGGRWSHTTVRSVLLRSAQLVGRDGRDLITPQQPVHRVVEAGKEIVEAVGSAERYFPHDLPPRLRSWPIVMPTYRGGWSDVPAH